MDNVQKRMKKIKFLLCREEKTDEWAKKKRYNTAYKLFVVMNQARCVSLTNDSLLVDWKLTVWSFFFHGSYVLEYANSSNQGDSFFTVYWFYEYVHSNQSKSRDRKKPSQPVQTLKLIKLLLTQLLTSHHT